MRKVLMPYLMGDLVDCFLHPYHTCLLESHWHRRCGLISKNSPVNQARWVFVHSFLLLRNHFGFNAIRMIAAEAGFYLSGEVVATLRNHDHRAQQQSDYYKDDTVKHQLQLNSKIKRAKEKTSAQANKKAGFSTHGYKPPEVTVSAKPARKRTYSTASSAATASSPVINAFFCEVCSKHMKFDKNDYVQRQRHCASKVHTNRLESFLRTRREEE